MRTLHLFSHWQTGNSVIQLAVAAICMEEFGFEQIMPCDNHNIPAGFFPIINDKIWDIKCEMIGVHGDPRMQGFYKDDAVIQGYFQNSQPLVEFREKIGAAFKDPRLHFPITRSGATIKELMETPSPIELRLTDVIMHVRLGDYRDANWVIDPAPQLAILRKIRRLEPATRIIIVCQAPKTDAERNYLKLFEEFHPLIQSGTELEDFSVLRSANRILVTNSTFSWAAAWLGSAIERWIPEPTFCDLGAISPSDTMYRATHGYDLSGFDIIDELLPVTGEFLQGLCEYTILDAKKEAEIGHWITARKLFIEDEWSSIQPRSLFIYPEDGLLDAVVARGLRPRLIVIHNGDTQANYSVLIPFLEANPQMYAWVQNNTVRHPRIRSIPICEQNRMWRGGRLDWEPTVTVNRTEERSCDFLYTWCSATHTDRLVWMAEAKALRVAMPNLELYPARIPREDYSEAMISAKAVVCPRGNGLDTHRAWETLYKGAWAIVPDNQHTARLLEEYPSLPLIPLSSPAALPTVPVPEVPSPFHPILLRQFWKTLFASHVD